MLPRLLCNPLKVFALQFYPAYLSYKAIKHNNTQALMSCLMYWVVLAFVDGIEGVADVTVFWFPFYNELKTVFMVWLILPQTKGSTFLYQTYIHPLLIKHESEIDKALSEAQSRIARAGFFYAKKGIAIGQKFLMEAVWGDLLSGFRTAR
ncbi:hypothetical protein BZG36_04077 [Bifiguratus adelaidae]|uniref:Protein YOP1 n=1 Tax=Bifiguratus adelaidae TaxID=1938954 RepID=A0A261XXS6_9FUNG|nr:hypothetical protein BZG36_04077 [Bifiguratus adelaidae]